MGVNIYANGSSDSFYMSYGGFANLRTNIALSLDREFGEHYNKLWYCHDAKDYQEHDRVANQMMAEKQLDGDIVEFLYSPDVSGSITAKTCKKIHDIINDIDLTGKGFQYVGAMNGQNDYERFKAFLQECYSRRCKMRWR